MTFRGFMKSAVIGAGLCIFAVGIVLAQTPPAPSPASPAASPARAAIEECRGSVDSKLRGDARRDAMRKCIDEKRAAAGLPSRAELKATREKMREVHKACRTELKDQRFTEDERREAIDKCLVQKEPRFAKVIGCRKDAEGKKLERRTEEYRDFMRTCMKAA